MIDLLNGLSPAARFERILSALCRQHGGELRVKYEYVHQPGEATKIVVTFDKKTMEIIVRGASEDEEIIDAFKVNPEQAQRRIVDPASPTGRESAVPLEFTPRTSTLDDDARLVGIERKRKLAQAMRMVQDELNRRRNERDRLESVQ